MILRALFTGAAVYVDLVEHPARMERGANTHRPGSAYAARELTVMGSKNVAHYPEGKQGWWMEAGLPVEKAA